MQLRLQHLLSVLALTLPARAAEPPARPPLPPGLARLAPECLVVYGKRAPDPEREAARRIAAALRAHGGTEDNLRDDLLALRDPNTLAVRHLILVGTYTDNELLHEQWGHLAMDRPAFLAEATAPDAVRRPPFYENMPRLGFFVGGFGTFRHRDTGYLEAGRNDRYLVPLALKAPRQPEYRIRINVTGFGPAGVVRAARALLETGLLNGVLPGAEEALPDGGDALILGKAGYTTELPRWVPRAHLLGWTLPDATEYAGFLQLSGQPAMQIWRARYLLEAGIKHYKEGPHRRQSANELFAARMTSAESARAAIEQLRGPRKPGDVQLRFEAATLAKHPAWQADGFHIIAVGPWVLMETLPEPLGKQTLEQAIPTLEGR